MGTRGARKIERSWVLWHCRSQNLHRSQPHAIKYYSLSSIIGCYASTHACGGSICTLPCFCMRANQAVVSVVAHATSFVQIRRGAVSGYTSSIPLHASGQCLRPGQEYANCGPRPCSCGCAPKRLSPPTFIVLAIHMRLSR